MLYNHIERRTTSWTTCRAYAICKTRPADSRPSCRWRSTRRTPGSRAKRTDNTGFDDIRIYATARVFLHNVPHLKALWMYLGEKMAQVLLAFGVDDIGATYHYEKVVHAAGAAHAGLRI